GRHSIGGKAPRPGGLHSPVLKASGFRFPSDIAAQALFETTQTMSSGPSRKTVSLAWGADPLAFRVPDRRAKKGESQMYKNAVNLIGFIGRDAEVKAAQENSTNFTVLSLAT